MKRYWETRPWGALHEMIGYYRAGRRYRGYGRVRSMGDTLWRGWRD